MNGRIGVEVCDQPLQVFLRRHLRQVVLNGVEAALLGHLALGVDVGVACRIITDDDDGEAGLDPRFPLQCLRCLGYRCDDRRRGLLSVDDVRHALSPVQHEARSKAPGYLFRHKP